MLIYLLSLLQNLDHATAVWFHAHLTQGSSGVLLLMSDPGCPECVGSLTAFAGIFFAWKRHWHRLLTLGFALPGGMLVNEIVKVTIHRARPYQSSPYLDLGGYSFPSAHTMAATLIYGVLAVFAVSMIKTRHFRVLALAGAALPVLVVAFSRVALGAHYVTDVAGAMALSIGWLFLSFGAARKLVPAPVQAPAMEQEKA
ncbi:MAG TPA: phosphatase PAP2 family protein [Chthoniobacteraceae bacterium]|nr:phosphatase PAP2 family protein [Chthoniobacteraceae bacterium]